MKHFLLAVAAACAGASGLALETLLLQSAGLALGYGRSAAIGLSVYIAAWAAGAFLAGARAPSRIMLLGVGAALAIVAGPLVSGVIAASSRWPGGLLPPVIAVGAIVVIGALQGAYLPLLASAASRSDEKADDVSWLIAASLLGSVLGAYFIGDVCVASIGRTSAAWMSGGVALLAGACGWIAHRSVTGAHRRETGDRTVPSDTASRTPGVSTPWRSYAIVGFTTAWMCAVQWIGLRLGVLWLDGMQPALSAILCASLFALAAGAWIVPRIVRANRPGGGSRALTANLVLCVVSSSWFVFMPDVVRWGAHLADGGASPEDWKANLEHLPLFARACILVGPALLPFGSIIPILHRMDSGSAVASGARLGNLYLHEAWGALLGVPILQLVVVPRWGTDGALALAVGLGAVCFAWVPSMGVIARGASVLVSLVIAGWIASGPSLAAHSPPLMNPALSVRALKEDRDFAVAVVDDGLRGERTLLTDGFRAAGTGGTYRYMRVLGHLPILMHAKPRRVAVLALGTGTTVGSVSLHADVERIEVLELSREVVAMSSWFSEHNHAALAEGLPGVTRDGDGADRITVRIGDGRATLAHAPGAFDVITMEPLLPDSPFAVYLYTREFYDIARRALADGGLVCQWVPPHALEPTTFEAVLDAFAGAFEWSSVWWFGSQVILLGGQRAPALDARRFEGATPDLTHELASLGIATPAGLVARFVGDGAAWRTSRRKLTDADPWVIYRPRRSGVELLRDLPANLAELRRRGTDAPRSWIVAGGAEAADEVLCVRALRSAEEEHARSEARVRGATMVGDASTSPAVDPDALERAPCASDPEVRAFHAEQRFLGELRQGVSLLAAEPRGAFDEMALRHLLTAAELRRERADVHAYLAVALERLGSASATRAVAEARKLCPRIASTREGLRARALGLSDEAWELLRAAP